MVVASIFSIPLDDIMTTLLKARKENGCQISQIVVIEVEKKDELPVKIIILASHIY
jgi:hypothetical protein